MMRFFLVALALVVLVNAAAAPRTNSGYDLWTGAIRCRGRATCLHEAGHRLDAEGGWISQGEDYGYTVAVYRWVAYDCVECRDEMSEMVMFFPGVGGARLEERNPLNLGFWRGGWGGREELYAAMLARADGQAENLPLAFRKFYDFGRLAEVMDGITTDGCY